MLLNIPTNEIEQIKLAKSTSDEFYLKNLSNSIYVSVRRTVAKNPNTCGETIEKLSTDCSLNVSFIANMSNKNPNKRQIVMSHPCLSCSVDEIDYHKICGSCREIKQYNYQA